MHLGPACQPCYARALGHRSSCYPSIGANLGWIFVWSYLTEKWRVLYVVEVESFEVLVLEVNPHDYYVRKEGSGSTSERAKTLARALQVHPAVLLFPGWDVTKESAA